MNPLNKDDLIDVLEHTALAQLRALRALRRSEHRKTPSPELKRKSNMDVVYDILLAAQGPPPHQRHHPARQKRLPPPTPPGIPRQRPDQKGSGPKRLHPPGPHHLRPLLST